MTAMVFSFAKVVERATRFKGGMVPKRLMPVLRKVVDEANPPRPIPRTAPGK